MAKLNVAVAPLSSPSIGRFKGVDTEKKKKRRAYDAEYRKRKKPVFFQMRVDKEVLEKLDVLAGYIGRNRAQTIRLLIQATSKDAVLAVCRRGASLCSTFETSTLFGVGGPPPPLIGNP